MKIITEVQNNSKDTEEIMVALDLNDNADDALFRDKTLITTIYLADYARFKRSYLYCKEYGVESMVEKYSNTTWCIDASLNEVITYMNTGKTPNDAEKHFGDLREDNPLLGFESLVDSLGSIYLEASHKHVHGKGFAEISLPELDEVFSFIESRKTPKLSREDFMEFWRSDDMAEILTVDDRLEIFVTAPIGADDITAERLNEIIGEYSVENLSVIDTTQTEPIPFKVGDIYDNGRVYADATLSQLSVNEDDTYVPGETERRVIDSHGKVFAKFTLCYPDEHEGNSTQWRCTYQK